MVRITAYDAPAGHTLNINIKGAARWDVTELDGAIG
jgi:hypothetical protein